jgi:hypothetical protein
VTLTIHHTIMAPARGGRMESVIVWVRSALLAAVAAAAVVGFVELVCQALGAG